jgi:hypothetical protein
LVAKVTEVPALSVTVTLSTSSDSRKLWAVMVVVGGGLEGLPRVPLPPPEPPDVPHAPEAGPVRGCGRSASGEGEASPVGVSGWSDTK